MFYSIDNKSKNKDDKPYWLFIINGIDKVAVNLTNVIDLEFYC